LQVSEALPVSGCPVAVVAVTAVALTVTGFARAAVHVAVTWKPCVAESWTEGSLTVQLEFTATDVFAVHTPVPPPNSTEVAKVWPLAGARAAWSAVADGGATFKPITWQLLELEPPQPVVADSIAKSRKHKNVVRGNIVELASPAA
jgi:hypothetical protein